MSVEEYDLKFTRLFKYAPEEVATEELKRNKFEKGLRLEIREKMAIRPLTYVVLKEAALRAEEIEKEKNDREAKKKKPESTSSFSSRSSGTMFRGSGFQRENFRGRGTYGTVRPSGSTVSSSRSGPRSRGLGSDFRRGFGRSFSRGSSPQCAQCGRFHVSE